MAAAKKKAAAKPKKAAAEKKPRASRKELSQHAGPGHNSADFASNLDEALQGLFELDGLFKKDMAGYRKEFKDAYAVAAQKLSVRVSVVRDEFNRAKRRLVEIEKEKAYDPIEREQRQMIRAATSDLSLHGTPMGDLFAGIMAEPANTAQAVEEDDVREDGPPMQEAAA